MGVLDLDSYIKDWVLIPLKKITDPQKRLLFLYDQKKEFIQNYQGDAATKVEKEFDIIIEKEKLLQQEDKPPKNETTQILSVPDWCIVFYYLDEAGNQKGSKIGRFNKFITENNIINRNGKLTTKGSFKKQYYEIYHRINGTENSKGEQLPPLPSERIKNILRFLKKNKKALQTAKNDIVYLLNEIEENKKNDY